MAKQFIDIDLDELTNKYKSGLSLRQLAEEYKTSKITIKKKLLKTGIKILSSSEQIKKNPKKHKQSSGSRKQVNYDTILSLSNDHTISEISKITKTNYDTISRLLSSNNKSAKKFDFSGDMAKLGLKSRKNWDNYDNLYDLYITQKKSCGDIARLYDYHRETIRTKLINFNIKIRPLDEANTLAASKPANKIARSRMSKKFWKDNDYRNAIVEKLKGSHPIMPKGHSENVSKAMKKLYSNPEYKQKHKQRIKELWQTPTPKMLWNLHETHRGLRENTELKQFLKSMRSDEKREQLSADALVQWSDTIFLKYQLPLIRQKCSQAAKEAWQNKEYRNTILTSMSNRNESKLEKIIHSILDDLNIQYKKVRLGKHSFEFDICIDKKQLNQEKNLLIEVNGLYIHSRPKQIKRDNKRKLFWQKELSKEYRFETIWEYEFGAYKVLFDKIQDILNITIKSKKINLKDIVIAKISSEQAEQFYNKYHYLGKHRTGYHIAATIDDKIITCCSFSGITRLESAQKQGLNHQQVRQLSRYCISPLFHNKNLASYFLSRAINIFKNTRKEIKLLITFADQTIGHAGTIYKATNWILDGQTKKSYFYEKQKFRWHKKVIWDYARSMGMTESEFITLFDIRKIPTLSKHRYLYKL